MTRENNQVSIATPMTTAEREARYKKQTGGRELTPRQQRQIRKTALRLERGRHRKPVNRPKDERASKGRKKAYAEWFSKQYSRWLRDARRHNPKAKLGRYTPGQSR
jgi:hypothetical protein